MPISATPWTCRETRAGLTGSALTSRCWRTPPVRISSGNTRRRSGRSPMADEDVRFFLNALSPKGRTLGAPTPGTWKGDGSTNKDFLKKYAQDIRIEGQIIDTNIVHSVPSVFARAIQFAKGLAGGPLRDATVSQWRGLLAVFALKGYLKLTVEPRLYKVPPLAPPPAEGKAARDDLNLATILRNQLPKPEGDWDHWWLIYCLEQSVGWKLIGATSPWTIAFTPAEYKCPDLVTWQTGGLFSDPIQYFSKKGSYLELRSWNNG